MPDNEFSMLHENAEELGRPLPKDLAVQRGCLELGPGEHLSYLRWGTAQPDVVLLHGGGQNAHTWDSVLVVLNRPAIAFDLPGHGHSYRRHDRDYGPWNNAEAIAAAISGLVERPVVLVGMSLGGATAIRVTAEHPALFRSTLLVDVTPGVNDPERTIPRNDRGTVALIGGPPSFDTLEEMVNAAIALSPRRPASAVRRGVIHNSHQSRDGRWAWNYDLTDPSTRRWTDFTPLWDDLGRIQTPLTLLRGALSPFVSDEDIAELQRRLPAADVEVVAEAGHSIQSDQPGLLAQRIEELVSAS